MASDRGNFSRVRPDLNERVPSMGEGSSYDRDDYDTVPHRSQRSVGSRILGVLGGVLMLVVIAALIVAIMAQMGTFTVSQVLTEGSEHVDAQTTLQLAAVEDGANLLVVDAHAIAENIQRNPWIKSVDVVKEYPSILRINLTERQVKAVVLMNTGELAWLLSDDNYWIEPVALESLGEMTARDSALSKARSLNCLFLESVPSSMAPEAGCEATDAVIADVDEYLAGFSPAFAEQIVAFSVSSESAISCTLTNGVEISLGKPDSDVAEKEAVAKRILEAHVNDVTYINVRIPSKPSYRRVGVPKPQQVMMNETNIVPETEQTAQDGTDALPKTDAYGNLVDAQGRLVNEQGHLIDAEGNLIDENGNLVNENGYRIDEYGFFIDENGNRFDEYGNYYDQYGDLISYGEDSYEE